MAFRVGKFELIGLKRVVHMIHFPSYLYYNTDLQEKQYILQ